MAAVGAKALWLCMPITVKRSVREEKDTAEERRESFLVFVWKPRWFVLAQTEGAEYSPVPIASWDRAAAMTCCSPPRAHS